MSQNVTLSEEFAGGGVVLHKDKVLLIHKTADKHWILPTGLLAENEGLRLCALRTVKELSGYDCKITDYFGSEVYSTNEGVTHRGFYWMMNVVGGTFSDSAEVDEIKWVKVSEVPHKLSFQTQVICFQKYIGRVQSRQTKQAHKTR